MATNLHAKAPEWRRDIEAMASEFARSLPPQMPTERFVRTVLTAIQINPDLARADRHTLKVSCMRAAQDGLLPDGREGALVIYNTRVKVDGAEKWIQAVQWMPMVAGLKKKARNSGEIASITGHVVYRREFDEGRFRMIRGDEERIEHEPILDMDESEMVEANAIGAYAIGRLKDGTIIRAWRSKAQIYRAKSQSKAQNSLMWTKFWEEGWIKTAIRYLSKDLPSSTDKEGVDVFARAVERDDELYDFNNAKDVSPTAIEDGGRSKLDEFVETKQAAAEANGADHHPIDDLDGGGNYDPDTGELTHSTGANGSRPLDAPQAADDRIPITWPGESKAVYLSPANGVALYKSKAEIKGPKWREECLAANPGLGRLVEARQP